MAHTPARWLAAAALVVAAGARAVELGPVEVGSSLGEPLDARIPLRAAPGERFEGACFYLSHGPVGEGQRLTLALERSARGAALRVRSTRPFDLPAATFKVGVACPGREPQAARELALLVDPRSRLRAPTTAAAPPVTAAIQARDGATLASIARTIHPGDAQARDAYLEALGAANPELAARGAEQAIPAGTTVALPDLRAFQATRRAAARGTVPRVAETSTPAPVRRATAPQAAPPVEVEPPPPPAPRPAARSALASAAPQPAPAAKAEAPPMATRQPEPGAAARKTPPPEGGFVLRLSGAEMDLSRSRGIDDRRRAQLRERQLILDQDDQVSALLSMKHSLKQLEARVSELQLKLAGMPASFPERPAPAPAAPPKPAEAAPAKVAAATPAKPASPAPAAASETPPKAAAVTPAAAAPAKNVPSAPAMPDRPKALEPPRVDAAAGSAPPAPKPPAAATAAPSKPATSPAPAVKPPAKSAAPAPASAWDPMALLREYGAWIAALAALLLFALAYAMWRRHRAGRETATADEADDLPEVSEPPPPVGDVGEIAAPVAVPAAVERRSISSDEHLPTRLRDPDAGDLRRRYIEERFPEVASRAIRLEDTDSVVKGARLFYEDGELPRAIELLQLAIEARPGEVRLWLALFEIFRLERLPGEFAQLAERFQKQHGESDHWRKVRFFGREVDPGNPLYHEPPVSTLETIGPREARRLAGASAAFDPIAENWLNAPMDFENEVLANDLRRALMAEAGIGEPDLLPAPRAALRNVEMFTVA